MGRNICRHPDGNACSAIQKHHRQTRGQDLGLSLTTTIAINDIDGALVELFEQQLSAISQSAPGTAHGGSINPSATTTITLPLDQRITQHKVYGHPSHSIISSLVSMRVVLTQNTTYPPGRFYWTRLCTKPHR